MARFRKKMCSSSVREVVKNPTTNLFLASLVLQRKKRKGEERVCVISALLPVTRIAA